MSAIEYQTFADFQTTLKDLVAPEGVGEALQDVFRNELANALADIQTLIPWTRGFNVNIYTKGDVAEFCAASVFDGPLGKITQLFAYLPGRDCKKLYYKRVSTAKMDCWIEAQRCVQCTFDPPPTNIYDTPYCNYVICGETACAPPYLNSTEDDCKFKSLPENERIFSVGPDYKIYAAPRFPCQYYLLMQWQGIKRKWLDADLVPVDQQFQECVTNRMERMIAKKERAWDAMRAYDADYTTALRMLKFRYHDEQDEELQRDCSAAIERLLPAFSPLYISSPYPPCYVQTVAPADCIPPAAPTNLNVINGPGIQQLSATWTDNATDETSYEFRHRNITQDLAFVDEAALPADSTDGTFFDLIALDQDLIDVQVRAVKEGCASDWVSFQVNIQVNN